MFKKDVIKHFDNNKAKAGRAIGRKRNTAHDWGYIIPKECALAFERVTEGELKFNPDLYDERGKPIKTRRRSQKKAA